MMRTIGLMTALLLTGAAQAELYTTGPAYVLPSSDTGWDYITFDATTGRLFIARRKDGLTVFDTRTGTVVGQVEDSLGANGVLLVPGQTRAFVAMTDGTMLSFDTATLKRIDRIKLDDGDLNQGFYEPTTQRVHMVVGARPDRTTWISVDAKTGQVLGRTVFDSKKMDDPAADGAGTIYAPMRDKNVLNRMSAADLSIQATWPLGPCVQPVAVEYDHAAHRVLIACRGDKPVFIALDPADGRIVATLPIGRGVDGMVHDVAGGLLITAGGVDGTMSVIKQSGPDAYALVETITTRPMARVLALDAERRLWTVAAGYSQAIGADGKAGPVAYHRDSFAVLSYLRR